jgi:ribonuclease P protein component
MAKIQAITRAEDFRAILKEGSRTSVGPVSIHVRSNGPGSARLGMAVRGPGAILRNRVKRRLRSAFREASPPPGVDVLVRAGIDASRLSFQELVAIYSKSFDRDGS